jgi:Ca2+/Na+ antiporter
MSDARSNTAVVMAPLATIISMHARRCRLWHCERQIELICMVLYLFSLYRTSVMHDSEALDAHSVKYAEDTLRREGRG